MQNKFNLNMGHCDIDISQYLYEYDQNHKEYRSKQNQQIHNGSNEGSQCPFSGKVSMSSNIFRSAKSKSFNMNFQIEQFNLFDDELKMSQCEQDAEKEFQGNRKQQSKNKVYAKNYREKKKQYIKNLQEQNRFLKSKIDDLSFRLKQTQLELNKLKHTPSSHTQNFQTTRESILKQIQNIINASESTNIETLVQVKKKMKRLNAFDSKHKMDLLNYFMSELLENIIQVNGVYFIDSFIEKKGFWRVFDTNAQNLTRIDYQIAEILGEKDVLIMNKFISQFPEIVISHLKNFKNLWKKLYEDYINIINQGLMIESLCRPFQEKGLRQKGKDSLLNYFKLELYFEKVKYRKDLRQLRDSWFHDSSSEKQEDKAGQSKNVCKRTKLTHE